MGNLSTFPTPNLPYPRGASTSGNPGFPAHTSPTNPNPNFQQPYYQTMTYGSNIPPTGVGVPHSPIPDIFFPRTPAYITPNPSLEGEVNDGVRDQITRTLREFGFTPKGRAGSYQRPYPEYFDTIPYPRGFRVLDLAKFTGDDAKTTYEHIGQFLAQVNHVGIIDVHKIRRFPLSLTGAAFNWFTSLPRNSIDSWVSLEQKFHDYFMDEEADDEEGNEICVAEWVEKPGDKPILCSFLEPNGGQREEMRYTFDVSKCDSLFDLLLRGGVTWLTEGHIIPNADILAKKTYCKWHDSYTHTTSECIYFWRQVQSVINNDRLTLGDGGKMKLDTDPFPVVMVELMDKKILVRTDQAETTKGKTWSFLMNCATG
jgi:hypothetical protein